MSIWVEEQPPISPKQQKIEPKKETPPFLRNFYNHFADFFNNTAIHGFKYFTESGRSVIERLWWLTIYGVCLYVCVTLLSRTFRKWEGNQVFIGFAQNSLKMWDFPFPAVTICPNRQIQKNRYFFAGAQQNFNITTEEQKQIDDSRLLCRPYRVTTNHTPDLDSLDFLNRITPNHSEVLSTCTWPVYYTDCEKLFSRLFTEYGLCFSFNMLDKSDLFTNITHVPPGQGNQPKIKNWSYEKNYEVNQEEVYPMRVTNYLDMFWIFLDNTKEGFQSSCNQLEYFDIIVHHPAEVPQMGASNIALLNKRYNIEISPEITLASDNLNNYSPSQRKCLFSHEGNLKYFRIYTEENCKMECLIEHTYKKCGCTPYYMPRSKSTMICGFSQRDCVNDAKGEFAGQDDKFVFNGERTCDCLPSCASIVYKVNTKPDSEPYESKRTDFKMVFKSPKIVTYERNALFDNMDFWASCGGLFALFTGFSIISIVEIIYFLTLRWMCNIWNSKKNKCTKKKNNKKEQE